MRDGQALLMFILGIIFGGVSIGLTTHFFTEHTCHKEAIEANVAHYVVNSQTGHVYFEYKKIKE